MKLTTLLALLAVFAVSAVCVRLGFWQISRLHQKRAENARLTAALAAPPLVIGANPPPADSVRMRRVELRGRYDESRQVLLSGRSNAGSPGVDVVTPLLLDGDSIAVLVDRGWIYSADAADGTPEEYPEPGPRLVLGLAEVMRRGAGGPPIRTLRADSLLRISARWLDRDSLAARFPYAIAAFSVRQLPGPGVSATPLRRPPHPADEFMHVSYAVQWFVFAAILLGGSAALAWSRRRGRPGRGIVSAS